MGIMEAVWVFIGEHIYSLVSIRNVFAFALNQRFSAGWIQGLTIK
jgi:hypothetical protein